MSAPARKVERFDVDVIQYGSRARQVVPEAVERLCDSIKKIGLQVPISVRMSDPDDVGAYPILVTGLHRLVAAKRAGLETIEAFVQDDADEDRARLWEIAENLHRAELTKLERDEHIAEWMTLSDKVAHNAPPLGGAQPADKGIRKAVRELGIDRTDAQRAKKVAGLTAEAKEAAKEAGLDDNRNALLEAAKAPRERQAAVIHDIAQAKLTKTDNDLRNRAADNVAEILGKYVPGDMWDVLKAELATAESVKLILSAFNNFVGNSVMDRRYGA